MRGNFKNPIEKKQRQQDRARKALEKFSMPGYMAYLLTILSMVYIVDLAAVTGAEWD